ncbi:TPR-like protein [Rickenella mellea]|uniref:TPR-like protein n=1 Tax=Rickenella mellea TaxID=50990 RepID=A0A4Y7QF38_9AGAM|nr:TPR-like protein [Rickenella mellea]
MLNGRSIDIELGGQEVITIELDNLDPNPDDIVELLKESMCKVSVWIKLACEYWRKGFLEAAERIGNAAVTAFEWQGSTESLPPVYLLLANIQIAYARSAPKMVLTNARLDDMSKEKPKDTFYSEAAKHMNAGDRIAQDSGGDSRSQKAFLTRGVHQLATRSLDDALQSFDGVLAEKPTNIVALTGKARIFYSRRQFPQALKLFQQVLTLSPYSSPDPRIGIGLCLWAMDHKVKAKAAWQRSLEVHPTEWATNLLLGLDSINASKNTSQSDEERAEAYATGAKYIEKAFNANKRNAAAANALSDFFLRKGDHLRVLKLAERTIQFADTLPLLSDGYIHAGQIAQAEGSTGDAIKHFTAALKSHPKSIQAAVGLAQMQVQNDEIPAAIHTLDTLLQPPNPQRSLEAMVMLASLRAYPRPGVSSVDAAQERTRARDLFDHIFKAIESPNNQRSMPGFVEDIDMYVEIARLWQDESPDRMRKALQEAVRLSQNTGQLDPRLLNNLGSLHHMEGDLGEARTTYELALTNAGVLGPDTAEAMSTTVLYNLARVYEDQGDEDAAKDAYEKLLARHPEYVDAKVREAQLLVNLNRSNDAHELIKQALASQNSNLNIRAFYTHFLIHNNMIKPAKDFVFATLKDFDKHDVYSLCAAGWLHYHQARESRDTSSKGAEDRKANFRRSAEFYEKALQRDPMCAIAGQGLAIATAEDILGGPGDEASKRHNNLREALDVFGKIRESVNDMNVYLNMGHCYYARDEFDRAIESYETASKRCQSGKNAAVLMCLCRSWYAKANKDHSFLAMSKALTYAQSALHLQPNDKAVLYNVAMIEQKAAEMLFSISPSKRSLTDLQRAIDQGAHAQKLFASLAADKSPSLPYNKDIADQRRKYGDSMLRKGDEHLATQRQYEDELDAKLQGARQKRQEERDRLTAIEREREEAIRKQAEELAEQRRKAREEAQAWSLAVRGDSDDEKEKERRPRKPAAKRSKGENGSGEEGAEPKKKRKSKLKKDGDVDVGGDDTLVSGDEGDDRPTKKRVPKKRVVRDDDDEELDTNVSRKKQYKSKEMITDSDEEQ